MPRYLVKADTWLSHEGRQVREGQTVTINWPKGTEPKGPTPNLERLPDEKPAKADKTESLA